MPLWGVPPLLQWSVFPWQRKPGAIPRRLELGLPFALPRRMHTPLLLCSIFLLGAACSENTSRPTAGETADELADREIDFTVSEYEFLVGDRGQFAQVDGLLESTDRGSYLQVSTKGYMLGSYADPIKVSIENPGLIGTASMALEIEQRSTLDSYNWGDWQPFVVSSLFLCPYGGYEKVYLTHFESIDFDFENQTVSYAAVGRPSCSDDDAYFEEDGVELENPVPLSAYPEVQLRMRPLPTDDWGRLTGEFDYSITASGIRCSICG